MEAGSRCIAPTNLSIVFVWFREQYMSMAVCTGGMLKGARASMDSLANMAVMPAARYPRAGSISSSRSIDLAHHRLLRLYLSIVHIKDINIAM